MCIGLVVVSRAIKTLKTEEVFGILLQMRQSGFREVIGPPCTVDEEGRGHTSFELHLSVTIYTSGNWFSSKHSRFHTEE